MKTLDYLVVDVIREYNDNLDSDHLEIKFFNGCYDDRLSLFNAIKHLSLTDTFCENTKFGKKFSKITIKSSDYLKVIMMMDLTGVNYRLMYNAIYDDGITPEFIKDTPRYLSVDEYNADMSKIIL